MTTVRKNEPTPAKREAVLQIWNSTTGQPAGRGTDFISLGIVFLRGANTPNLDLPLGTMTNERRAMSSAEATARTFTYTADATTDQLHKVAHLLETGDGTCVTSNSGGALPGGLAAATPYYVIKVDADNFKVATSLANAYAGIAIDITSNGSGTNTWTPQIPGMQRGMDGRFVYRLTQAETDIDVNEMEVIVDSGSSGDYQLGSSGGGSAVITLSADGSDWAGLLEAGHTRDDALRALFRGEVAKKNKSGTTITTRDVADTKDSHTGTVTSAGGRTAVTINDLT